MIESFGRGFDSRHLHHHGLTSRHCWSNSIKGPAPCKQVLVLVLALLTAACQAGSATPTAVPSETGLPTIAASPSPNPSATPAPPTATASPAPRTFLEGFDQGLSGWDFVQVDNGTAAPDAQIESGSLRFDLPGPNQWIYAIYGPHTYTDVRIDAQVIVGGANGAAGVVCRYSQDGGWYELNLYPDQTYVLLYGQWLAPGVARYVTLVRSSSEKIQDGQNSIGLQCKGNTLTPFINGVQMRQRQENTYGLTSGKVAVSAASFEAAPIAILFDSVKVAQP